MKKFDRTSMGGDEGVFRTTAWTELVQLRQFDAPTHDKKLADVLGRYWKPVYCYLRRKGNDNEAAKDLTQGFFAEVVLGRDLLAQADPGKGRFRTFLLTALDRYARDVHRAASARKRRPDAAMVHLDGLESPELLEPTYDATPEAAFTYQWAATILDDVMADVRAECESSKLSVHWQLFMARCVQPILDESDPPPLPELCRRFGVRDEVAASNMMITVRRRFQSALRRHVRNFVADDDDVDAEIADLMAILSAGAGG